MSSAGTCTNCNIQQSSNQYGEPGSGTILRPIVQPRRRYNPAAILLSGGGSGGSSADTTGGGANESTSSTVQKVVKVGFQAGQGDDSVQKKKEEDRGSSTANLRTLEVISDIITVDSQMVENDAEKRKLLKSKTVSSQRSVDTDKEKSEAKLAMQQKGRKTTPSSKIVSQVSSKQDDKNKKKRYQGPKTFGTVLASAPEFKIKFNALKKDMTIKLQPQEKLDVPLSFDGRIVWKKFMEPVRNQGLCGACWAFSSSFVFAARLSIISNGKYNYTFSPAKMVFCSVTKSEEEDVQQLSELGSIKDKLKSGKRYDYDDPSEMNKEVSYGCEGETLINTWQFLYRYGIPENKCLEYGDENISNAEYNLKIRDVIKNTCSKFISNTYDYCPSNKEIMVSHRVGGYYYVPGTKLYDPNGSEYNIRKDIYHWGPCTTGMIVHQDFLDWDGVGIYQWDKRSPAYGGHAVAIVGWGEENGKKYWIVRNTWGEEWGDKGYFKILRGTNECEIEDNVFVGFPNIPAIRLFIEYPILYQLEDFTVRSLWGIRDSGLKETTYEQLALGKKTSKNINTETLYSIDSLPNLYTFLAGKITENYCTKKRNKKHKYNYKLVFILILLLILLITFF